MGCGKKSWAEDLEVEIYTEKINRYSTKNIMELISEIEKLKNDLSNFVKSEPSLTRSQWYHISKIEDSVKELLK